MPDLATMTTPQVALDNAMETVRQEALSNFAQAGAEEIMLAVAEKRLAIQEARRRLVMRWFNATDVAKLGDKIAKNKFAAEKLHELFGGTFEFLKGNDGKPFIDVQVVRDDPDVGEYKIFTLFGRYIRPDGKVTEQMGSFSTKDAFFAKAHDEWKTINEVNVVDVMVAAQTETYKKCIFRGVGLGDWTEEETEQLAGKVGGYAFTGSVAGSGEKDALIGFGKAKGKRPADLDARDLAWYLTQYTANVADPERAKFRKQNQHVLAALKAEQEKRAQGTAHEEATGTTGAPGPGEGNPTGRGGKITTLDTLLMDAVKQERRKVLPLFRELTKSALGLEIGSLTDLTDEQLDACLKVDAAILAATAVVLEKAGKK